MFSTAGSKLLTGGEVIQMWSVSLDVHEEEPHRRSVKFSVGGHGGADTETVQPEHDVTNKWDTIWRCRYEDKLIIANLFMFFLI